VPAQQELERRSVELLQRLIRFNTVNPPGNERAAQEYLRELLTGAGFEVELLGADDERPNLVATLRGGSDGPALTYLGHVDTVLADASDWTVDPWSGELRDDCVWGRGAFDMKGQVASEIAAVCALSGDGWRPESGELKVVVTADEEAGAAFGAQWLCREAPDKVRSDFVLNEGGGSSFTFDGRRIYTVGVAEKGVFRFTLTTIGAAGHASMPRLGDNALVKMAPLLEQFAHRRPTLERSPEPEAFMQALGIDTGDLDAALAEVERRDARLGIVLEPTLGVTFAPTMISASEKVNVIPGRAHLKVDCRVPPGLGEDHARRRIAEVVGEDDGFEIRFDEQVIGNRSDVESELMDHVRDFVEREDADAAIAPSVLPGFTDSRWFREAFPDCVAYGFCPHREMDLFEETALMHGVDERVRVEDLTMATRFYAELAPKVLG
jgi:acetylornithine deacetylase/succinyl-diaminopimelate desuccinylase-like protein